MRGSATILLLCGLLAGAQANAGDAGHSAPVRSVQVAERLESGPYRWRAAFDLQLIAQPRRALRVVCRVLLVPVDDVLRAEMMRRAEIWERAAEAVWSERFGLRDAAGTVWPMVIDVQFTARATHHRVLVRRSPWPARSNRWALGNNETVIAQEIGHLLGAYDEYSGGALDPADPHLDSGSVMSALPGADARARARHFALILRAAEQLLTVPLETVPLASGRETRP